MSAASITLSRESGMGGGIFMRCLRFLTVSSAGLLGGRSPSSLLLVGGVGAERTRLSLERGKGKACRSRLSTIIASRQMQP